MFVSRYVKGIPFFNGRYTKGVPFQLKMVYKRLKGWTSLYNILLNIHPPPPHPPTALEIPPDHECLVRRRDGGKVNCHANLRECSKNYRESKVPALFQDFL